MARANNNGPHNQPHAVSSQRRKKSLDIAALARTHVHDSSQLLPPCLRRWLVLHPPVREGHGSVTEPKETKPGGGEVSRNILMQGGFAVASRMAARVASCHTASSPLRRKKKKQSSACIEVWYQILILHCPGSRQRLKLLQYHYESVFSSSFFRGYTPQMLQIPVRSAESCSTCR